jgi:hypothetical protein
VRNERFHWGTFQAQDGNVHVAPCDDEGDLLNGHLLAAYCACGPKIEKHVNCSPLLVIHAQHEPQPAAPTRH